MLRYLCEPVPLPREVEQFLHYFGGDAASATAHSETEPLRITFYKATAAFARAYAELAQDLGDARYSDAEADALDCDHRECRAPLLAHSGSIAPPVTPCIW